MLMKAIGYGTKGSGIKILDICNNLASREWLMVYPTSTSPKEIVMDVFLENTLERNSAKERLRELPLLYILSIVTSWALFCIHQSVNQGMHSFLLIIFHASHVFTFSCKNQSSFNTSKISKPLLRHSQEIKSKSSELIMGESMSTMRYRILFMRKGFSCSTWFPILCGKIELLSGKIDL
jgi:hypothetical protein